jgi:hypothetical protein
MKLMSLAMKPISSPPFPLERIEEIQEEKQKVKHLLLLQAVFGRYSF